jgi:hypothetical protein
MMKINEIVLPRRRDASEEYDRFINGLIGSQPRTDALSLEDELVACETIEALNNFEEAKVLEQDFAKAAAARYLAQQMSNIIKSELNPNEVKYLNNVRKDAMDVMNGKPKKLHISLRRQVPKFKVDIME